MKRTTYILIALFFSGLIVIAAAIIIQSFSGKPYPKDGIFLGNEQVTMDLNGIRAVKISLNQERLPEIKDWLVSGEVKIESPSASSGKAQISYPKTEYLNVTQKEDTLLIVLDFNELNVPKNLREKDFLFVNGFNIHLAMDSLNSILTDVNALKLNLKGIETDSLFLRGTQSNFLLDSCRVRSLNIQGRKIDFHAKGGEIENFYLNLDAAWSSTFENTEVGTQYLSGRKRHTKDLQKGECRRVVWTPLHPDASLQVNLRENAEIVMMPK